MLSDTHGFLDPKLFEFLEECDEIWHAGDIGELKVTEQLADFRPLRAVWGNIDGPEFRHLFPEHQRFVCQGVDVFMTHIGGYPGRYARGIGPLLRKDPPQLFICGHSHIVRAMPDEKLGLVHFNPGACGRQGFHHEKTMMRFTLHDGEISQFQICRLGAR